MNVALITARGGSKGLPGKNLALLNGYPLIVWTIRAAQNATSIDAVYVTTEDEEISRISEEAGAKIIPRPTELAQDDTSSEPVIAHALDYLHQNNVKANSVTLLQPTSPLRTAEHIDEAYALYQQVSASCVISVFEPAHSAAKAYKLNTDGTISGLLNDHAPYQRRQDLPHTYHPNGAIYIFNAEDFEQYKCIPRHQVFPYVMSTELSIDIDTAADLLQAEQIMEKQHD